MYKQIKNYNIKTQYYYGVKTFWSVQGYQSVIIAINKLNSRNKAGSQPAFTCSKLTIEILEKGVKYVQI